MEVHRPPIQTHTLPTPASAPHGLTLGPDVAEWVALEVGLVVRFFP